MAFTRSPACSGATGGLQAGARPGLLPGPRKSGAADLEPEGPRSESQIAIMRRHEERLPHAAVEEGTPRRAHLGPTFLSKGTSVTVEQRGHYNGEESTGRSRSA
jgi:hypothetical protein